MANFIEVVKLYVRPYYVYILILVSLIIFSVSGYYAYQWFYRENLDSKKYKDVANENRRNKEAIVYMFHVDWCPHCKTAMPQWQDFKSDYDGREINGYVLKCVDMNCTNDTDSTVTKTINEYGIAAYPTIKLLKDEEKYDFESKITRTSLEQFVTTVLRD